MLSVKGKQHAGTVARLEGLVVTKTCNINKPSLCLRFCMWLHVFGMQSEGLVQVFCVIAVLYVGGLKRMRACVISQHGIIHIGHLLNHSVLSVRT